ncbi:hypothetical protein ACRS6B_19820 [Nocardia asteroides]
MDRMVGPLVDFNLAHPGFKALFARTDMPATLREAIAPAQEAIHGQVETLIGIALPEIATAQRRQVTTVAIQLLRGMMPMIVEADEPLRSALTEELRLVLRSYLLARAGSH